MQLVQFTAARADTGAILPYARATVFLAGTSTKAQLFNAAAYPIDNPVTADGQAFIQFATPDGLYDVQVVSADQAYSAPLIKKMQVVDLVGLRGTVTSGRIAVSSWAELEIKTGTLGQVADVPELDAGTHTDPMTEEVVPNSGVFRCDEIPTGWRRLYASESSRAIAAANDAENLLDQTQELVDSLGFERFVTNPGGSDSYNGLTPGTPWETPAHVAALAAGLSGKPIGFARGSVFPGAFDNVDHPADNLRLGAYGRLSRGNPVFDGSILLEDWSPVSGEPTLWTCPVTLHQDDSEKNIGNVYKNGVWMPLFSSQAACEAAPGSAYVDVWQFSGGSYHQVDPDATVMISSATDPRTDGSRYEISNGNGVSVYGDGAVVENLTSIRAAQQNGCLNVYGENALIRNVRLVDGSRHMLYVRGGAVIEDSYIGPGANPLEEGTTNGVVLNDGDLTGATMILNRVDFDAGDDTDGIDYTCVLAHSNSEEGGPPSLIEVNGGSSRNANTVTLNPALVEKINDHTFENVRLIATVNAGNRVEVTDCSGTVYSGFDHNGGTLVSARNSITIPLLTAWHRVLSTTSDAEIYSTDDELIVEAGVSTAPGAVLVNAKSGSFTHNGLRVLLPEDRKLFMPIYDASAIVVAGYGGGAATWAGGGNEWPYGSSFLLNGTTYDTLAEFQADGYEVGSTTTQPKTPSLSDNFNRANENLDVAWTRIGGTAGQATVTSNKLSVSSGGSETAYRAANLATPDGYVRAQLQTTSGMDYNYLVIRLIDKDNFVGVVYNGTTFTIVKRVAGVAASLDTRTYAASVGADMLLGTFGDEVYFYVDGQTLTSGTSIGAPALAAATGCGVVVNGASPGAFIDDFSMGQP